jgi:hypothetical protein
MFYNLSQHGMKTPAVPVSKDAALFFSRTLALSPGEKAVGIYPVAKYREWSTNIL